MKLPRSRSVRSLREKLEVASGAEAAALLRRLEQLARRRPWSRREALCELARHWTRADERERAEFARVWGEGLGDATFELAFSTAEADRVSAATLAADLGSLSLRPLLIGLLRDEEASVGIAAAHGCERLIDRALEIGGDGRGGVGGEVGEIRSLLAHVLETFDTHRSESALRSALEALCGPGVAGIERDARSSKSADAEKLSLILNDGGHPAMLAARSMIRRAGSLKPTVDVERWRVRLSRFGSLRTATHPDGADPAEAIPANLAHLSLHPDRRQPSTATATKAGRGGGSAGQGLRAVGELRRAAEAGRGAGVFGKTPMARLAEIVSARDGTSAEVSASLRDLCFDPNAAIARSAALALLGQPVHSAEARAARGQFADLLRRSPHASVRQITVSFVGSIGGSLEGSVGEGSRSSALSSDDARGRLRLHRRAKRDSAGLAGELRAALMSPAEPDEIIAAIRTCRRLEMVDAVEDALRTLVEAGFDSEDEGSLRVAASASAVLASTRVRSLASCATLLRAARSADARVRANAVEAICKRAERGDASALAGVRAGMGAWMSDAAHRPRAAAAVWAWKLREELCVEVGGSGTTANRPLTAVAQMLVESKTMMRLAALWAAGVIAERPEASGRARVDGRGAGDADTDWVLLKDLIDRVAADDGDEEVRRAAAETRVVVAARMRRNWMGRSADLLESAGASRGG